MTLYPGSYPGTGTNWAWNIVLTSCLFSVPFFLVWSVVNSTAWYLGMTSLTYYDVTHSVTSLTYYDVTNLL